MAFRLSGATAASPHGCTALPPTPPSTSCAGKSTIWGTSRWEEAPERPDPQQPELLAEQREQQEALQRALDQLSSEHRQVLLLRVVQQLSYDEIAQALSLESGTVKSRISRARRQLREILLRQGNFFPDSAVLPNGKEG